MKTKQETTILVVDDEPGLRKAISFEFKRCGYQVLTAENGNAAKSILRTQAVDAVISDIRMPGGDGIDLLKSIKSSEPDTPFVIFITAFSDLSQEDAYDLGAEAILSKPFDRKTLRDAIARALLPREERWFMRMERAGEPVQALRQEAGTNRSLPCLSLGKGGMFVELRSGLPAPETAVEFRFAPPLPFAPDEAAAPLAGRGIVRWVRNQESGLRPPGCGIEFTYLEDGCRASVLDWIDRLKRKSFIPAS